MKCKNCDNEIEDPELNNGKLNCEHCGWIIGYVSIDENAVELE